MEIALNVVERDIRARNVYQGRRNGAVIAEIRATTRGIAGRRKILQRKQRKGQRHRI